MGTAFVRGGVGSGFRHTGQYGEHSVNHQGDDSNPSRRPWRRMERARFQAVECVPWYTTTDVVFRDRCSAGNVFVGKHFPANHFKRA